MIIAFNSSVETVSVRIVRFISRAPRQARIATNVVTRFAIFPPLPAGALIGSPCEIPFPLASPAPFSFFISPCLVADHRGNPALELTRGDEASAKGNGRRTGGWKWRGDEEYGRRINKHAPRQWDGETEKNNEEEEASRMERIGGRR